MKTKKKPTKRVNRPCETVLMSEPANSDWARDLRLAGFTVQATYQQSVGWDYNMLTDDTLLEGPHGEVVAVYDLWNQYPEAEEKGANPTTTVIEIYPEVKRPKWLKVGAVCEVQGEGRGIKFEIIAVDKTGCRAYVEPVNSWDLGGGWESWKKLYQ